VAILKHQPATAYISLFPVFLATFHNFGSSNLKSPAMIVFSAICNLSATLRIAVDGHMSPSLSILLCGASAADGIALSVQALAPIP